MIHTLSQLPALGYCALAFFVLSIVAFAADEWHARVDSQTFVDSLSLLYFRIGLVGCLVTGPLVVLSALLNVLRLVGVL